MDPITSVLSAIVPVSAPRSASSVDSGPVIAEQPVSTGQSSNEAAAILVGAAAQQAYQPLPKSSGPIADMKVLGTQKFAIFRFDGVAYTRYTDVETGKVTYYPQAPQYVKLGQESGSTVSLEA